MKVNHYTNKAREKMAGKLKDAFSDHIGLSNAIMSDELYHQVTGVSPIDVDYYEREYKWNAIKRMLSVLRKDGTLFTVMGTSYHYVLNDQEELDNYKSKTDATIRGLKAMKVKAEKWVDSDALKELKKHKKKEEKKKVLKVVATVEGDKNGKEKNKE